MNIKQNYSSYPTIDIIEYYFIKSYYDVFDDEILNQRLEIIKTKKFNKKDALDKTTDENEISTDENVEMLYLTVEI